ncbi:MAG: O-antigen ligase family protein [Ignavibacteriae bacterium]|nr:O-antigen ligase family protein [Ignavibacteriota bacterium]
MTGMGDMAAVDMRREWRTMLIASVVFTAAFVGLVVLGGGRRESLLVLPLLAAGLIVIRDVERTVWALIVVLFIVYPISLYSSAVVFSALVAVSFLVTRRFAWRSLRTPLTVPIVVYGLAVLPSLLNAGNPLRCIAFTYNVVAFLIALHVPYLLATSMPVVRRFTGIYLGMAVVNGIQLILMSLSTGRREYGFSGLMYGDYAGIAVNTAAVALMVSRGRSRMILGAVAAVVGVALIMTQTRNAWISAFVTLSFAVAYLIRSPELAGISRRHMIRYAGIGALALVLLVAGALALNPDLQGRAASIAESESVESGETLIVRNSLISRMMIWDAALNAFLAHPWAGVGVYGFAMASRQYSHLPAALYDFYVRDMSPHVAVFAVLSETGLLGFAGFLFFVGSLLRVALRSVRTARDLEGRRAAFIGLVAVVYIMVSMFFTDAWLWGQGIVLLGLIAGMVLAIHRMYSEPQPDDAAPASAEATA